MKSHPLLFRKIIAMLLLAVMFCSSAAQVFAATQVSIYCVNLPRGDDPNKTDWGHDQLTLMNGTTYNSTDKFVAKGVNSYTGKVAYCVEPGKVLKDGDGLEKDENFWENLEDNKTINASTIQMYISRIMYYGYSGKLDVLWSSTNSADANDMGNMIATQILIWEVLVGERDSKFDKVDAAQSGYNNILDTITSRHPIRSQIMSNYNRIVSSVKSHSALPSFMSSSSSTAESIDLIYDSGSGKYKAVLTDSNNVLSKFTFSSSDPGISFSASGNKLTITSDTPPSGKVSISANKSNCTTVGMIIWSAGGVQSVVTYGEEIEDPVVAHMTLAVSAGTLKIVKTSEDGNVAGIEFTVTGNNFSKTVKTGSDGSISIDNLAAGTYTVTEKAIDKYTLQSEQHITVVSGQTATVTFDNTLRRGSVEVVKESEDGRISGIKFRLYGTSLSGAAVDVTAVTDEKGVAKFENILVSGEQPYTIEEVGTSSKYVIPKAQNVTVRWKETSKITVENKLKKFCVTATKSDAETGTAQGGASLAGAVYGLYLNGELVESCTTDKNGSFTTGYHPCGDGWTIREITPSEGYLLDKTVYTVDGSASGTSNVELNNAPSLVLKEQIIKGDLSIIKHTDDGSTQIETPEVGATFEVFLASAGSYDAAKDSERDLLVCDENGYAISKKLPYGTYTVKQTTGWDGRELMKPFEAKISANGETVRYLINNAQFEAYLKVVKVDAESGKAIPYAGAGFQILDSDGDPVTMSYTYPTVTKVDTFYTGDDGSLVTPEKLPQGKYSLREVQAPHGYVLNSDPVSFEIDAKHASDDGGVTVVKIVKENMAQKATIVITKTGETFSSVTAKSHAEETNGAITVSDTIYTPVYEETGLQGAVFEVKAATDIYTPDGTLRYEAGTVVDTVTTGTDGKAVTKALYLGEYFITEIEAPAGYIRSEDVHSAKLEYAGQQVEITQQTVSYFNSRQKATARILKELEQNELYGITGDYSKVVFGLFAAEKLIAADGSEIPADGLLEIAGADSEGNISLQTDLPYGSYYVKELSTDGRYVLSEEKYGFDFKLMDNDYAQITIPVNNGEPIINKLAYGSVCGIKTDNAGVSLPGALIGLFKPDTTEFTKETALLTTTSAEDGLFRFDDIPCGSYIIREIAAPEGYVLSDEVFEAAVTGDDQIVEITLINRKMSGSVQLTKVDEDYPENKLTGAVFEVYIDAESDLAFDAEKDTLVGTLNEIEPGIYRLDDLDYGDYFLREIKAPEGFVLDTAFYAFSIKSDGTVENIENKAGIGFINKPITGTLKITKTDLTDGKLIPNAGFRIKDEAGKTVVEGYTDENGIAEFELRYGKYTYQEFDAPDGYLLDESEYPFEITENGQIVTAGMTNELIPVETPQTGDDSAMGLWIAMLSIGVMGMAALCALYFLGYAEKLDVKRYALAAACTGKVFAVCAGNYISKLTGTVYRFAKTKLLCRFAPAIK